MEEGYKSDSNYSKSEIENDGDNPATEGVSQNEGAADAFNGFGDIWKFARSSVVGNAEIKYLQNKDVASFEEIPKLFDLEENKIDFFEANVVILRQKDLKDKMTYDRAKKQWYENEINKLIPTIFWSYFITCISEWKNKAELLNILHNKLAEDYAIFFHKLQPPKDDILDLLTLLMGIQIYMFYTSVFANESDMFDMRFLCDCLHFIM